jgi:MFS family permease
MLVEQLNDAAGLAEVSAADVDPSIIVPATLTRKKLGRGFWVFFAVAFFFDLGFAVYFFLFNLYLLDLHFNERSLGLVGGALTLGSVVGTLPAGWLGRKLGLRPLLAFCLVSAPILGIARALVFAEWEHIGLAFMAGLAMCLWGVCFLPMVAALTDEENRATAFGLIFSVSIGSSAVGELVCSYLPHWLAVAGFALQAAETKRGILIAACCVAMERSPGCEWCRKEDPGSEWIPGTILTGDGVVVSCCRCFRLLLKCVSIEESAHSASSNRTGFFRCAGTAVVRWANDTALLSVVEPGAGSFGCASIFSYRPGAACRDERSRIGNWSILEFLCDSMDELTGVV